MPVHLPSSGTLPDSNKRVIQNVRGVARVPSMARRQTSGEAHHEGHAAPRRTWNDERGKKKEEKSRSEDLERTKRHPRPDDVISRSSVREDEHGAVL
jgi:hypothetical protein